MAEPYILKLLGGVSLAGPDGPLEGRVVQHRQLALLALLASARNRSVSRDKLIATLWPDSSAERARHSLSDALHILNKALGERSIMAEGDELRLDPTVVASDVAAFEEAVADSDSERAVDLYGGPFLDVSGALEFGDWAAAERERLARMYGGALERLAKEASERGEPRAAAEWWARSSAQDPYDARVAVRLMEALAAAGDRGGAIQHAMAHTALLRRELDAEADPVVTDLACRLRQEPAPWSLPAGVSVPPGGKPEKVADRKLTERKPIWGASAALGLALLIGGWAIWPQRGTELTTEEAWAVGAAPGIAVLPFRVNDPALETWREGMVDLLSVNLDGTPDLRAIDSRTLLARWREAVPDAARPDLPTSLAVARRTGARYALIGTVVAVGPDLRLSTELYEARSGIKLGSVQVVGAPDSMLVLVNRLTIEVLRALPRGGNVLADIDLAEVTTNSLDALKDFLSGEAFYRRADFNEATAAFERAIASDSTFALAWARLRDTCSWGTVSELCGRDPPGWREEYLNRLPPRRADYVRHVSGHVTRKRIEALWQLVRKYPDDPDLWYRLGDGYWHYGDGALADPAEGVAAFQRAIALAPTTSAEPYIHLIQHAFAEADSAEVARLLGAYGRITAGERYREYRLASSLGFGDPATRARTRAALDTIPVWALTVAILNLGHPRLHGASREALRVLLARPDHREDWADLFDILYRRGKLRAGLDAIQDPVIRPGYRAALIYRLHEVGVEFEPEELERILAAGAADTTAGNIVKTRINAGPAVAFSNFLWVGAYAVDRGDWEEYAAALDRQHARARSYRVQGDSLNARRQEAAALALEGYGLWKRGRRTQALHALETAQQQIFGGKGDVAFVPNFTVRGWLGELMLEVGRWRDAERYFKSLARDPFAALRLGKVYEELGEFDAARAAYEYALLSWQDADPELEPRIREGRQALARLPEPMRRE